MSKSPQDDLREKLAAIEHERWADWQKWCNKVLRENNPSHEQGDILERWDRQIETPYAELSGREKASDMEQVDRQWPLIQEFIASEKRALLERLEDRSKRYYEVKLNNAPDGDPSRVEVSAIPLSAITKEKEKL